MFLFEMEDYIPNMQHTENTYMVLVDISLDYRKS